MEAATDGVAPEAWRGTTIDEFPRQAMFTTFGVLDDASEQRGVVSSTHLRDGRICSPRIEKTSQADARASRATLQEGDLAVVLVRRTGDAALVTAHVEPTLSLDSGSARSLVPQTGAQGTDAVTPTDLFDLSVPYIERSRLCSPADASDVWGPGTFMLATRPDGAHIALTERSASPTRGVLAVSPLDLMDKWWLLHELRSRSSTLVGGCTGTARPGDLRPRLFTPGRHMPDARARTRFHKVTDPLHSMAKKLAMESRTLYDLKDALLRDISARSDVLSEEQTLEPRAPRRHVRSD